MKKLTAKEIAERDSWNRELIKAEKCATWWRMAAGMLAGVLATAILIEVL